MCIYSMSTAVMLSFGLVFFLCIYTLLGQIRSHLILSKEQTMLLIFFPIKVLLLIHIIYISQYMVWFGLVGRLPVSMKQEEN